jgi:hypothetical protein
MKNWEERKVRQDVRQTGQTEEKERQERQEWEVCSGN